MEIVYYQYLVRAETMIDHLYTWLGPFDHVALTHDKNVYIPMINLSEFQRVILYMLTVKDSRLTVHFSHNRAVYKVYGIKTNYMYFDNIEYYSKVCL